MGNRKKFQEAVDSINIQKEAGRMADKYGLNRDEVEDILKTEVEDVKQRIENDEISIPDFLVSQIIKATKQKVRRKLG